MQGLFPLLLDRQSHGRLLRFVYRVNGRRGSSGDSSVTVHVLAPIKANRALKQNKIRCRIKRSVGKFIYRSAMPMLFALKFFFDCAGVRKSVKKPDWPSYLTKTGLKAEIIVGGDWLLIRDRVTLHSAPA